MKKTPKKILWISFILMFTTPLLLRADVVITLDGIPESIQPGSTINASLDFEKTPDEQEKRIVFLVDLHRASDNAPMMKTIYDNNGNGYPEESGSIPLTFEIPPAAEGSYYVKAAAVSWSLNRAVVARYKSYPTDGTYTYKWSGGYGVTQNIYYLGSMICSALGDNTTYCSGIMFETCVMSFSDYNTFYQRPETIGAMSVADMKNFRLRWYGVNDTEKLCVRAIPEYNIGIEITDWEEAQEGDFIQLWRHSGSGHNCLFVKWLRNTSDEIIGVRYWSSQSSSNGIGYNQEYFGESSGLDEDRFYLGRLKKPRDNADLQWALGTTDTQNNPTIIIDPLISWYMY